jgi:hypothetical protein
VAVAPRLNPEDDGLWCLSGRYDARVLMGPTPSPGFLEQDLSRLSTVILGLDPRIAWASTWCGQCASAL